jgi:Fe-S oxidoreductase
MHLSIILGVGLSMLLMALYPILTSFPILAEFLLAVSVPLVAGLVAAMGWRARRYLQSKRVEEQLHSTEDFSRASATLQAVLTLAVLLTAVELAFSWFPFLMVIALAAGIVRNCLVAVYYGKPAINLIRNFDLPLSEIRTPFKLGDVMDGKVDASQISSGVSTISGFESFERLSYNSCVEIGACESACPATAAGRSLSPRVLVRKLSLLDARDGGSADPLKAVEEGELWACTSCGACVQSCPVAVKHLDVIYDLRRRVVNAGTRGAQATTLQNLTQTRNPYGLRSNSRGDWARGLGIDTIASNPRPEYLYWVGCVSSFDERSQKVARSMVKVLTAAGLSFAVLGGEESCCGDPARRLGEEGQYQELAYQNIERMNSYGIKKIITTCPHCFNTLKNEYPSFGGNYEVVHHGQLLSELIREGKLRVKQEMVKGLSVTLHDACYASRYNGIIDEPRRVLMAAGGELREMHRNRERTFCCGAGGSNYWYQVPQKKTISGIRTEEAVKTGAGTIATECPFCLSMFDDSTRTLRANVQVRDIAEILAEMLDWKT